MKKIVTYKQVYYRMLLLATFAMLTSGCKKEKLNNTIPLLNVANESASSIRLFNYYGDADVTVNNIPLTTYSLNNNGQGGTTLGLSIFPSGLWQSLGDASPFTLPNSLLDKDGKAHFSITTRAGVRGTSLTVDTIITNNVAHPQDYYFLPDGHIKALDRVNLPSTNPQSFKIRIINLGSKDDKLGLGLIGAVSLTYADGSQVNTSLNNITEGASSGYVELPYGAYQFKLFIAGGGAIDVTKQLAESPNLTYYDPCNPAVHSQEGISPRVRTFKPGGVYSIVITQSYQDQFVDCNHFSHGIFANSYRVITELDPGVNSTYAGLQAINAIPEKQITITVDGKALGDHLPYIGSSTSNIAQQAPYQIFVQGNHHIQAIDQNGVVLAAGDLTLYPYDNYTIWAYNKPDGKSALMFEANDMSGTLYKTTITNSSSGATIPDDGTNGGNHIAVYNYALQSRFLNLSTDLPYATFTNDQQLFLPAVYNLGLDTIRYFSAYVNLASGIVPVKNPYIIYSLPPQSPGQTAVRGEGPSETTILPSAIRVYSSKPGNPQEVPGALVSTVAPINVLTAFIANPNLYTVPNLKIAETGIYTVALVGQINASQASEKARIVVIKHNK